MKKRKPFIRSHSVWHTGEGEVWMNELKFDQIPLGTTETRGIYQFYEDYYGRMDITRYADDHVRIVSWNAADEKVSDLCLDIDPDSDVAGIHINIDAEVRGIYESRIRIPYIVRACGFEFTREDIRTARQWMRDELANYVGETGDVGYRIFQLTHPHPMRKSWRKDYAAVLWHLGFIFGHQWDITGYNSAKMRSVAASGFVCSNEMTHHTTYGIDENGDMIADVIVSGRGMWKLYQWNVTQMKVVWSDARPISE